MTSSDLYEVPLVQNDLRKEETMVQIVGALTRLTRVSDHIFRQIEAKCAEFTSKVEAVGARLEMANSKIDILRETKTATVLYSSGKGAFNIM